jgi:hypothetical protein
MRPILPVFTAVFGCREIDVDGRAWASPVQTLQRRLDLSCVIGHAARAVEDDRQPQVMGRPGRLGVTGRAMTLWPPGKSMRWAVGAWASWLGPTAPVPGDGHWLSVHSRSDVSSQTLRRSARCAKGHHLCGRNARQSAI